MGMKRDTGLAHTFQSDVTLAMSLQKRDRAAPLHSLIH